MSLAINDLLALTEAAAGFNGGTDVDHYPQMSLQECAAALPQAILESQIELYSGVAAQNEATVQLTVETLRSGVMDEAAIQDLNEASFKDIWERIKAFFAKIKKFIQSIIAKVTLQIDKLKMSGNQLWAKYGKSPALRDESKFKDLTFEGYEFTDPIWNTTPAIDDLIKEGFGNKIKMPDEVSRSITELIDYGMKFEGDEFKGHDDDFKSSPVGDKAEADHVRAENTANMKEKVQEEFIKPFDDITKAERIGNMARKLTGLSESDVSDDTWQNDVRKYAYGEKKTLNYGEGMFTVAKIGEACQKSTGLQAIKDAYTKLKKDVDASEKALNKQFGDFEKKRSEGISKYKMEGTAGGAAIQAGTNMVQAYYNKYLEAYQDATSVIAGVRSIHLGLEQAKINQAKSMLVRLINAGGKKAKAEDASDIDDSFIDSDSFDLV